MYDPVPDDSTRARSRSAIIDAATRILESDGPDGLTTRAVAVAAEVQPPTIYRLFGDKDGLIDAVAEHVYAGYVASKTVGALDDPIADLRVGWDVHLAFGLANPGLFALMVAPHRRVTSPAIAAGIEVLRQRVRRIAAAGRLRVSEQRAVDLIHATGTGVILTLLASPESERDPGLAELAYDGLLRTITNARRGPADSLTAAAVTLRSDPLAMLTTAEATLFREWLDRIIRR